jgi:hypothetical protein
MLRTIIIAAVVGGLAVAGLAFVVVLFAVKFLWAWTVPDLFPGAVAQGLIAPTISWWTATKVALIMAILSGVFGGASRRNGRE